jgi:hypothetical protein
MTMPMTRDQLLQMQASARVVQGEYDDVFQPWGFAAPAPTMGEHPDEYRRRMAIKAKKLLPDDHKLRTMQISQMPDDAFNIFEPQYRTECKQSAYRPDTIPYDAPLRRVEEVGSDGLKIVKFIGQRSFIHDFTIPGRRVKSFLFDPSALRR